MIVVSIALAAVMAFFHYQIRHFLDRPGQFLRMGWLIDRSAGTVRP
jgi:hypothetical protein